MRSPREKNTRVDFCCQTCVVVGGVGCVVILVIFVKIQDVAHKSIVDLLRIIAMLGVCNGNVLMISSCDVAFGDDGETVTACRQIVGERNTPIRLAYSTHHHCVCVCTLYSLCALVYAITFSIFIIGRVRIVVRPHRRRIVSRRRRQPAHTSNARPSWRALHYHAHKAGIQRIRCVCVCVSHHAFIVQTS